MQLTYRALIVESSSLVMNNFFKEKILDLKPIIPICPYKSKTLESLIKQVCIEQYGKDSERILEHYQTLKITIDKDIE